MGIREDMQAAALAAVGLGADVQNVAAYAALIADGESAVARDGMIAASGCALVVRGLWRHVGLCDPRLEAPYVVGSAITTIVRMGYEAQAFRPVTEAPELGDVIYLASGAAPGAGTSQEHVATFTSAEEGINGAIFWNTIDGGQRDADGHEKILARRRRLSGRLLDGRLVVHVINLDKLAARFVPADDGGDA